MHKRMLIAWTCLSGLILLATMVSSCSTTPPERFLVLEVTSFG